MDTLKELQESGIGDQFWYVYAIVVTSLLVGLVTAIIFLIKGFLTKFLSDIKETHNQFAESITMLTRNTTDLQSMVKLHENELKNQKEDIEKHDKKIEEILKEKRRR